MDFKKGRVDIGGIGSCSCLEAALWGVYEGLATSWSLRYPRVLLETDSCEAFEVSTPSNYCKVEYFIISSILEMISRSWEVRIVFVRRKGNALADAMSRLVQPESLEYRRWLEPLIVVRDIALVDVSPVVPLQPAANGYGWARLVNRIV
ncbi:hypothetical protein V6N11_002153 [Hibiscus sabdariffa]|uniref:RNase H type-1 domain-containing protein n=1 Tax=Hibiscus sabdariffa TaxID=183260 RepID=A0ABR2QUF4_9ROSI